MDGRLDSPLEIMFEPESGDMNAPVVIVSKPPPGCHRVVNVYMSDNGKLVVEHSDIPA